MEYGPSDSSGTDDDLPPTHQNRGARVGRVIGNERALVGAVPYPRVQNDMEIQIHQIEQDAYSTILRAFKAQSDAITWEKESLISELRKELRISNDEHRELLNRVNADDVIRRIREWRQGGGLQTGLVSNAQPVNDPLPSPAVSASRKRQKPSQSIPSLAPSPSLHSQPAAALMQPLSLAAKEGAAPGARGKKSKSVTGQTAPNASAMKSMQYASTGPNGRGRAVKPPSTLIGRKVLTRWPEDNNFYEAVITNYNPVEGLHALVYDMNTNNETWEWVNLKEISPEDIRWGGEGPDVHHRGRGGVKKSAARGGALPPGAGSGRGGPPRKNQPAKNFPSQNGVGRKKRSGDDIQIWHTETLIKEVEMVFAVSRPDPLEVEKAKKMLKDHEQSLIDAIARLADASDGESEDG